MAKWLNIEKNTPDCRQSFTGILWMTELISNKQTPHKSFMYNTYEPTHMHTELARQPFSPTLLWASTCLIIHGSLVGLRKTGQARISIHGNERECQIFTTTQQDALSTETTVGLESWNCQEKQKQAILCGLDARASKKNKKQKKHLMRKNRLGWKAGIPLHQLCPLTYPLADWGLQPVIRYQTNHIHKIFIIWQSKHTPYRILLSPTSTKPHIQQTVNKLNAEHWALEAFVFSALCNHLIQ